jgi:hypothetical protein
MSTESSRATTGDPNTEYAFELIQDGIVVASVFGPDRDRCFAEIMHYAQQYAQDGACIVRENNSDVEIA